jgi:hypothetical protein
LLDPSSLGLRRDVALEHQPIRGLLDAPAASRERVGRDLLPLMVQADRAPEDMAELQLRSGTGSASAAKVRCRT